jgi:type IV secretion system protein VirD4
MSAPHTRQDVGSHTPLLPWLIIGGFAVLFAAMGAAWVAAQLAAGDGFEPPTYGSIPVALRDHGVRGLIGPTGSAVLFTVAVVTQIVMVLATTVTCAVLIARRRRPWDGRRAMVAPKGFRDLQRRAMAKRALGLRPSLAGRKPKHLAPRDIGTVLGDVTNVDLYKSFEDVELVICGPRSGKTSAKVVPEIIAAPGTVVATSNKPDVWILTSALRARIGPVFLFDPMRITYQPQQIWIDLLKGVVDVQSAARLAGYFMREVGGGAGSGASDRADPFFTPAAATALRQLLLAAACAGKTLRDVLYWVSSRSDEPAYHLEHRGFEEQAIAYRGTLELAPETKGGIFQGVATALASLESEELLRWVTPPATWKHPPPNPRMITELDLWSLITRVGDHHPTVYLLSREGEGSGRAVIAAVVGELIYVATQAASARGGRLDPPVTLQLDEAANIVRLPELPNWYSWFGSVGLMVTVVLQSREQGRAVWGKEGFDALWSAATIKTVGAGVQDADFCEYLSQLVGQHKVPEISTSYSPGGTSTSRQPRTERILEAADIAALDRSNALLFTSGRRPALLNLHFWFLEAGDERDEITSRSREATQQVQHAAIDYLGPDNPVAKALLAERAEAEARAGTGRPR